MAPAQALIAFLRQVHQIRQHERATGLVRVTVTVRAEYVDDLKRLAADLRDPAPRAWTDPMV